MTVKSAAWRLVLIRWSPRTLLRRMGIRRVQRACEQTLGSTGTVQNFKLCACPLNLPYPFWRIQVTGISEFLLVSAPQTRSSWMLVFKDREMLGESENCISFVGIHSWIVTNMRKRSINIDQSFRCWVIRSFYIHVSWSKLSVHWQYHQMYFWDNTVQLIIDWPRTSHWCRRSFRINLNSFFFSSDLSKMYYLWIVWDDLFRVSLIFIWARSHASANGYFPTCPCIVILESYIIGIRKSNMQ